MIITIEKLRYDNSLPNTLMKGINFMSIYRFYYY